jgi:hypothetical protein
LSVALYGDESILDWLRFLDSDEVKSKEKNCGAQFGRQAGLTHGRVCILYLEITSVFKASPPYTLQKIRKK